MTEQGSGRIFAVNHLTFSYDGLAFLSVRSGSALSHFFHLIDSGLAATALTSPGARSWPHMHSGLGAAGPHGDSGVTDS